VVAPRDDAAGGTWLGLNERGLFVGVTNRFGRPPDPTLRSRGALVADALRAPSAAALHGVLAALDAAAYNPFHLFYADRVTAHLTWYDGGALGRKDLGPGLHIVTERSFSAGLGVAEAVSGAAGASRVSAIEAMWRSDIEGRPLTPDLLRPLLVYHSAERGAGTCVHMDDLGYGTRSSLLLTLGDDWSGTTLLWAEGRPCRTPFEDRADLIRALSGDAAPG
jgi:hypothetical protein